MSDSWAPDEPAAAIYAEDTYLQGTFLMCIAYGAVVTLSVQCFFLLMRKLKRTTLLKDGPLMFFVIVIFALSTITTPIGMYVSMNIYINDRNYPGGPSAYLVASFSNPINSVANACIVTSAFVSDALLLWRCTVIYRNSWTSQYANMTNAGIAVVCWITEFILGILFLIQLSSTSIWGTVNLTLGFWCCSLAVNALATILIVGRLGYHRWRLSSVLGSSHAQQYTGIISMIVESELLYTAFLILYIVPFALNHPLVSAFIQAPALVQAVSALMIVYRVAEGKGWTTETCAMVSTSMQFGTGSESFIPHRLSTFTVARGVDTTTIALAEEQKHDIHKGPIQLSSEIYELERKETTSAQSALDRA